jgi:hypothetical protein
MSGSFKTVFNGKGRFSIRQLEVGEEDVRNELRVGLYDAADACVGCVTIRVDSEGAPQFVMTTGGDGFLERETPLVIVAPTRPHTEAVSLVSRLNGEATPLNSGSTPDWEAVARNMAGALAASLTQIEQMKGLFDDADGTIAQTLDDIDEALSEYQSVSTGRPVQPTLYLATHCHRHGEDHFLFDYEPEDDDVIAAINEESSYEPDQGESFSVDRITVRRQTDFIGQPIAPAPRG